MCSILVIADYSSRIRLEEWNEHSEVIRWRHLPDDEKFT